MPKKAPIQPYERPVQYQPYKKKHHLSPVAIVCMMIAIWYVLIGKDILPQALKGWSKETMQEVQIPKVYYEFTCSEANFSRILGITLAVPLEEEEPTDQLWYEKYYRRIEELGVTTLQVEEAFNPLSGQKFQEVISTLFDGYQIEKELVKREQLYLYEVLEVYQQALLAKSQEISTVSLTILATPTDEMQLEAWQLASDQGLLYFEGLVVDPIKNQSLKGMVWNDQLLGITEIESTVANVQGCTIIEVSDEQLVFEVAGNEFSYPYEKSMLSNEIGKVGTLQIEAGKAVAFIEQGAQLIDTLVSISDTEIVLAQAGSFSYQQVSLYDQTGENRYQDVQSLPYGIRLAYTAEGRKLTSIQVIGNAVSQDIRVVLTSGGSYEQSEISIVGDADYDLMYQGKATTLDQGTLWTGEKFNWEDERVVRFIPREESYLTLNSVIKGGQNPRYRGIIEVTKTDTGYIVVNEVDLENYVAGVLPSEMPTSYGIEALKAQAVAIRTYAMAALNNSKYTQYGAHVDDTTASQVYQQTPDNESSYQAAKATAGLVLTSNGQYISNKFFGTSYGYTANFGEVWAGAQFPSTTPSYLISRQQYLGDQIVEHLEDEANFKAFITLTAEELDAFDEASPWFRWKTSLTREALENLIFTAIDRLGTQYSHLISYESVEGKSVEGTISEIGHITRLKAEQRGEGGNLMVLGIYGEKGTIKVATEYLIRSLFASNTKQSLSITRSNQTVVQDLTLLPSAFFSIEESVSSAGELESVTLLGGGNGHGVGLSQDGAKGMADRGYTFREILAHYYSDCELTEMM